MTARPVRVAQLIDGNRFHVSLCFDPERIILDGKRGLEITLSPLEAALLDSELLAAATPPPTCDRCQYYASVSLDGVNLCAAHHYRADVEANMDAGRER